MQQYLPGGSWAIGLTLVGVLLVWGLSQVLRRFIKRLGAAGHINPVMAGRLQAMVRWAVLILAALALLQTTGLFDNAWAMLSAVLATVAIGFFAVWSLLSNATGALLILTFRPFRHGDQVELVEPTNGTALGGRVVEVNLMFTTLEHEDPETGTREVLQVPNNLFFQKLVRTRPAATPQGTEPFYRDSRRDLPPS